MNIQRRFIPIAMVCITFTSCQSTKNELNVLSAPAGNLYTSINKNGTTVLPNGRLLTPAGKNLVVAPHPFGLTFSGDGKIAVTANSGVSPLSISIIRNLISPGGRNIIVTNAKGYGRIFDPQKALSPLDEKFDWHSLDKSPLLDDPREMVKDRKEKVEFRVGGQKKK